jgi:hypothetical protein
MLDKIGTQEIEKKTTNKHRAGIILARCLHASPFLIK